MKLSVIIPTLNRDSLLRHTLKSIEKQTMPQGEFEIIVIDNGSSDNTKQVCEEYNEVHGNLIYIYDESPGLHVGRNRGFKESRSENLVYIDDDIDAGEEWLESIYNGFKNDNVCLIGGNDFPIYEDTKPGWINRLWIYDCVSRCRILQPYSVVVFGNKSRQIDPCLVFGCNFSVRKEIVKKARGFHPDGVPDLYLRFRGDGETYISEYVKKRNMKAMFYPGASVGHRITQERMTIEYIKKVAYRSGISSAFTKVRNIDGYLQYFKILKKVVHDVETHAMIMNNRCITDVMIYNQLKGELYLLKEYGLHKDVRDWVKKDNYIDAIIPQR